MRNVSPKFSRYKGMAMNLCTVTGWWQRRLAVGVIGLILGTLVTVACVPLNPGQTTTMPGEAAPSATSPPIAAVGPEGDVRAEALTLGAGVTISYTVVLPPDYSVDQPYPLLLALPPGSQTPNMVAAGLDSYWQAGALANGWVVVSPVAPDGQLYFQGAETYLPEFLDTIARRYPPEGDKFYLSGISNGGLSAFRIAGSHPERFHALLVLPGYPPTPADAANLPALKELPVAMYVGANDSGWLRPMRETAAILNNQGGTVILEIVPDEGHFIRSLIGGEALFAQLESFRQPAQ